MDIQELWQFIYLLIFTVGTLFIAFLCVDFMVCHDFKVKPHPRYLGCGFIVTPTGKAIAARCLFLMFVTA